MIVCRNCGKEFTFTVGEQNFYEEKGLKPPVRCKECKAKRKEQQTEQSNNIVQVKSAEEKKNDFEEMLERFRANTILFEEEIERRNKKRK
ncbi:MAG: zinc-ribbon domain containing protein [Bacilli bacterium]|nr:zinc-ribbon domain containing protein [Bacilli bacterium]MBQ7277052.1 zinc-ribbon domain containing protein [Bacilli bacterium]